MDKLRVSIQPLIILFISATQFICIGNSMTDRTAPAPIERASVLTVAQSLVSLVTFQNQPLGSKYIFDNADRLRVNIVNPK